ncbi:MAG: hypothetical protein J1E84_07345 [Muribaculaceae bacterium]|nr:hypothetical protein [Muribaculaceae bacterium]
MTRHLAFLICVLALSAVSGCRQKDSREALNDEQDEAARIEVKIKPIYKSIHHYPSLTLEQRKECIDSMREGLVALSAVYNADLTDEAVLLDYAGRPVTTMFSPAVDELFPAATLDSVNAATSRAFSRLKQELPAIHIPEMYGVISPYDRSIYMVDSVMLVALNHYLGYSFDGYNGMPEYKRTAKTPRRLPYNIVEAMVGINYPYTHSETSTLLARMLHSGAIAMAQMMTIENADIAEVLNFAPQQLEWAEDNEKNIWNKLVADQLLFSTDPTVGDRLVLPSPGAPMIHQDAPGQIGGYVGYRILKKYMALHPETTLEQVLSPEFYTNQNVLRESEYTGQ